VVGVKVRDCRGEETVGMDDLGETGTGKYYKSDVESSGKLFYGFA
jgi:hypothetical protein